MSLFPLESRTRDNFIYTSQYCEENVYLLAQKLQQDNPQLKTFAVFVSNTQRLVVLSEQRAAKAPGQPVYWDYHVILFSIDENDELLVWDLDTTLPFPCDFDCKL